MCYYNNKSCRAIARRVGFHVFMKDSLSQITFLFTLKVRRRGNFPWFNLHASELTYSVPLRRNVFK